MITNGANTTHLMNVIGMLTPIYLQKMESGTPAEEIGSAVLKKAQELVEMNPPQYNR